MDSNARRYAGLLSLGVALTQAACMESRFRLADNSPIPRSLEAPASAPRSSLSVTFTNYSVSNEHVLRLEDSDGKVLKSVDCTGRSYEEKTIEPPSISINGGTRITRILEVCGGIEEVFEFRGAGRFYVINHDSQK